MTQVNLAGRRPLSLNNRVLLFVTLAITLSYLLIGHLIQVTIEQHFEEQDADELRVITHSVKEALLRAQTDPLPLEQILDNAVSGHHGVIYQVWDGQHQRLYGPDGFALEQKHERHSPDQVDAEDLELWVQEGKTYRIAVVGVEIGSQSYTIVAAIDINFHLHFLEDIERTLWMIMLLAGSLTLLAAWYGIHQGHAPLRKLSESLADIQADHLDMRLNEQTVPAELSSLVRSFNQMLCRLEESFLKLSNFSADIAHELRTPLTNLITQTQVALGKSRSLEEYHELLYSNLEEQERLTKMVNDMLWLAQSDNGLLKPDWHSLDLLDEVTATFEFFEALAEEKNLHLILDATETRVQGDRAMLRRALSNLLSNAIRYSPEGEQIRVAIFEQQPWVYLTIENHGSAIPNEALQHLFDRFYRVDPSRKRETEGAGLGLAIVKSIVEMHEGSIETSSEKGLIQFTIRLPAAKQG